MTETWYSALSVHNTEAGAGKGGRHIGQRWLPSVIIDITIVRSPLPVSLPDAQREYLRV